jgi:hypothetical protein
MTAPVPAHESAAPTTTAGTPVPVGHVSAEDYERYRAEQLAAAAPAPAAPTDFEDRPHVGPGQAAPGEWLADAEAETRAEQATPAPAAAAAAPQHDGPPPGWYVDPADKTIERWWDGSGYPGPSRPSEAARQAELEKATAPLTDEQKAERAAAEREAKAQELGATAVPLEGIGGRTDVVYVLPNDQWPSWSMSRLQVGDFEAWAERCLAPGYYDEVWLDLDPTMGQVNDMFKALREINGTDSGKSRLSSNALRRSGRK